MKMYKTQRENCQPRILQPVKISFHKWGLNKFLDKRELRECITSRSSPQEMLKDVLQTGREMITDGTLIIQREINTAFSKYVDTFKNLPSFIFKISLKQNWPFKLTIVTFWCDFYEYINRSKCMINHKESE